MMDDDDVGDAAAMAIWGGAPWWLVILIIVLGIALYRYERNDNRQICEQRRGVYTHVGKQWLCMRRGEDPFIPMEH